MNEEYLKQLRVIFSTFVLSSLYRDVREMNKTPEDAIDRISNWDIKYGSGSGIPLDVETVKGLLGIVDHLTDKVKLPTTAQRGTDQYGLFFGFMEPFVLFVEQITPAQASELITAEKSDVGYELKRTYDETFISLINNYWINLRQMDEAPNKESVAIFKTLYSAVLEYRVNGLVLDRPVLIGMKD